MILISVTHIPVYTALVARCEYGVLEVDVFECLGGYGTIWVVGEAGVVAHGIDGGVSLAQCCRTNIADCYLSAILYDIFWLRCVGAFVYHYVVSIALSCHVVGVCRYGNLKVFEVFLAIGQNDRRHHLARVSDGERHRGDGSVVALIFGVVVLIKDIHLIGEDGDVSTAGLASKGNQAVLVYRSYLGVVANISIADGFLGLIVNEIAYGKRSVGVLGIIETNGDL